MLKNQLMSQKKAAAEAYARLLENKQDIEMRMFSERKLLLRQHAANPSLQYLEIIEEHHHVLLEEIRLSLEIDALTQQLIALATAQFRPIFRREENTPSPLNLRSNLTRALLSAASTDTPPIDAIATTSAENSPETICQDMSGYESLDIGSYASSLSSLDGFMKEETNDDEDLFSFSFPGK